jgi:hypothetical protein
MGVSCSSDVTTGVGISSAGVVHVRNVEKHRMDQIKRRNSPQASSRFHENDFLNKSEAAALLRRTVIRSVSRLRKKSGHETSAAAVLPTQ